eukprot:4553633-Amphidinium_carterae.1
MPPPLCQWPPHLRERTDPGPERFGKIKATFLREIGTPEDSPPRCSLRWAMRMLLGLRKRGFMGQSLFRT